MQRVFQFDSGWTSPLTGRGPIPDYFEARLAALAARFSIMLLAGAFLAAFMVRCSLAMGGSS